MGGASFKSVALGERAGVVLKRYFEGSVSAPVGVFNNRTGDVEHREEGVLETRDNLRVEGEFVDFESIADLEALGGSVRRSGLGKLQHQILGIVGEATNETGHGITSLRIGIKTNVGQKALFVKE